MNSSDEEGIQLGTSVRVDYWPGQSGTAAAWYPRLVAAKFDGSQQRSYPGRPRIGPEIESLIARLARENRGWATTRIVGALAHLGYEVSARPRVLRRDHPRQPGSGRTDRVQLVFDRS